MTDGDHDNLNATSTDMLAGMLGNTEKMISTNKRWNYNEHRNEDNMSEDDKLDVDANTFMKDSKHKNVFGKHDSDKHNDNNDNNDDNDNLLNNHNDRHHRHESRNKNNEGGGHSSDDDRRGDREADTSESHKTEESKPRSKREERLLKLDMIRKLCELQSYGVKISEDYNMSSNLEDMQNEYQLHYDFRSKQNSVKVMSHLLIGVMKGAEIVNDNYNPFDIKLAGLSNTINSDINAYYAVLGDIYEKHNQPGKQSAPEMRLLFMICGTVLSMQVNRLDPDIGKMANMIRGDNKTLDQLRTKAENDTKSVDHQRPNNKNKHPSSDNGNNKKSKENEYADKQHELATQKANDLKMLREKELESQKINKMNVNKIRENLHLTTESPHNNNDTTEEESEESRHMSREEIEHIKKMRYIEEQRRLEAMRQMAHQKSNTFRNNNSQNDQKFTNNKKQRDLDYQNEKLNNILESVEDIKPKPQTKKPKTVVQTIPQSIPQSPPQSTPQLAQKTKPRVKSLFQSQNTRDLPKKNQSHKKTEASEVEDEDNQSSHSSRSSISYHPKLESLMTHNNPVERKRQFMNNTQKTNKPKITKDNLLSEISIEIDRSPDGRSKKDKTVSVSESSVSNTDTSVIKKNTPGLKEDRKANMKFDQNIQSLLELNGDSEYDDMSRDDISFGSIEKNMNKKNTDKNSSKTSTLTSNTLNKENKTKNLIKSGAVSIGSLNKGTRPILSTGGKR
jgi:hypothetical protein